jgi:serine/arginine repetitive matrix protein 2
MLNVTRSDDEPSPRTRRNRDLAQVLFGVQDRDYKEPAQPTRPEPPSAVAILGTASREQANHSPSPESTDSSAETTDALSPSYPNPLSASSPKASADAADLAREVQRKADAAMLALKRNPSQSTTDRIGVSGSISRRRVSPGQISTPRLVSASTSVDTIPLRSPSAASGSIQGSSKLGQRFRRLRGTLRAKTSVPYGEEVTPYPIDVHSPPTSQVASYDPATLKVPGEPTAHSATEIGTSKFLVPSPPASAGPGLRGFMARFRKTRTADASQDSGLRVFTQTTITTPVVSAGSAGSAPITQEERSQSLARYATYGHYGTSQNAGATRYPRAFSTSEEPPAPVSRAADIATVPNNSGMNGTDDAALRQLFAAASNLGLDQAALNDLLARSNSTRAAHRARSTTDNHTTDRPPVGNAEPDVVLPNRAVSPALSEPRPSVDIVPSRLEAANSRKPSVRRTVDPTRRARPVQDENATAVNAIVRRTIIYPSESRSSTIDLSMLMRKPSQSTRRRRSAASGGSMSSRSIHDRAPTPPPPKSSAGRRFSTDSSPPVPQLPNALSSQGESLSSTQPAPAGPIEKSSSTYDDSLYVSSSSFLFRCLLSAHLQI